MILIRKKDGANYPQKPAQDMFRGLKGACCRIEHEGTDTRSLYHHDISTNGKESA
jgi:hypothetical protein